MQNICVYVLEDRDIKDRTYIGYTSRGALKRLADHHSRMRGARYTRGRRNRIGIVITGFPEKGLAMSFEHALKKESRNVRKLKGIPRKKEAIRRLLNSDKWTRQNRTYSLKVTVFKKK